MMGRGNTGPVYPWFGKDIRQGINLAIENYALLHRLWREDVVSWRASSARRCRASPRPPGRSTACPRSCGTARSAAPRSPSRPPTTATASSTTTSSGRPSHTKQMVDLYRRRFEHYGHGSADQAIVGLGGQFFMRRNSQDAVDEFRPYFDNAPVYGHGPSLEEFTEATPLTVGSPQQVLERTLGFREYVGHYQRQLFLVDHAGLPLKTVLEQLDLLGEILPDLRAGLRRGPPGARARRAHARVAGGGGGRAARLDRLRRRRRRHRPRSRRRERCRA